MANEEHLKILRQGVEVWNKWRWENPKIKPDLNGADLSGADLSKADLDEANLHKANLVNSKLIDALLREAKLSGADLSGADLIRANLKNAKLNVANLDGANLYSATLDGANLYSASLINSKLTNAHLDNANISYANLNHANLAGAKLRGANLRGAKLHGANLDWADLSKANLSEANLSKAVISEGTRYRTVKGCQVGVNGFWCKETDSAALMTLNPPGNSMQGSTPDAVIESLKRARRLHGSSMLLAATVLFIAVLGLETIKFTTIDIGQSLTPEKFGLLAIPVSIALLSLVASFMSDALKGARYLSDRDSAMKVGNFPWVLSKYAGPGLLHKLQSFLTRLVMTFHPLVYFYYWGKWRGSEAVNQGPLPSSSESTSVNTEIQATSDTLEQAKQAAEEIGKQFPNSVYIIFIILLILFSVWIFVLSQRFQKPVLFDTGTESERRGELTAAIGQQTEVIKELVNLLKAGKTDSFLQKRTATRKQKL